MNKTERKRISRRFFAWMIALAMTVSAVDISGWGSIGVQAAEAETVGAFEVTGGIKDTDYSYADGMLTIKTDTALTIKNTDVDTATSDRIFVEAGVSANLTFAGVNILRETAAPVEIADDSTGDVTITLADNTENNLKMKIASGEFPYCAALQKNGAYSETLGKLTIQCTHADEENHICTESCGTLTAEAQQGSDNGAGIGGANMKTTANIYITGGNINASSRNGAGIGGGYYSPSTVSHIYVSGGNVKAFSLNSGAGIGSGGGGGNVSDIYISGGRVTAESANNASGIGANYYAGKASAIYISGGSICASSRSAQPVGCSPVNADGKEVYLLTTPENSTNERVYVDETEYPFRQHSTSDSKLYLYLPEGDHSIQIGDTFYEYALSNGQFVQKVKGTDFEITPTDAKDTLIEGVDYTYYQGGLVVKSEKGITVKNTGNITSDTITVQKDVAANITLAGVMIDSENTAMAIADGSSADVTVILADNSVNALYSGNNQAALQKTGKEGKLIITCEHAAEDHDCRDFCGKLTAAGTGDGAGIGGTADKTTGDIVITGGNIEASGDDAGAGIGDGNRSVNNGSGIYISGGVIVAHSERGAGIGCGASTLNKQRKIVISGGLVEADSAKGAGIGGNVSGVATDVTINGGSIKTGSIIGEPHNAAGEKVYAWTIENKQNEQVTVDGVTYPFRQQSTTDSNLYVYLTEGVHTINGKTITCSYSTSKEKLLYAPVIGDLAYTVPEDAVYNGKAWNASVSVKEDAPYSDNNVELRYYDSEGTRLNDAPVNAGTYTVKAYLSETQDHVSEEILIGTFIIRPAEIQVSEAAAKDRMYDGSSKKVEVTDVILKGVITGDDVSVKLTESEDAGSTMLAELSSLDAGSYTEVILPELTLTGADAANYTLIQPIEPVALKNSVTITKADAKLTAADLYNKCYGDEAFTLDVTDTNTDINAEVTYTVLTGSDVVSVEKGAVTIKKAGDAEILVSLPESKNYHAAEDKRILIHVAKKAGYTLENIDRSYTDQGGHTDSISLKTLLPADCGEAAYETPVITGTVTYSAAPVVTDGILNYTVGQGSAGNEGTIQISVHTENYADITITVNTKLTAQPVSDANSSQGSTITPGSQDGTTASGSQDGAADGTTDSSQTVKLKMRTVTIPAEKKVKGKKKKVTSVAAKAYANDKTIRKLVIGKNVKKIGKRAFYGCSNIKTIVIKTEKLKESSIGADAFKGISKNAVVKVPKKLVKKYKKILRKKGLNKKVKVKAM